MTETHLERAADAAAYANRLQADLGRVTSMLNDYRGSPGLEIMRERSHSAQRQLEMISRHLAALGRRSPTGHYTLTEAEHLALDTARDILDRLVESLARYQRAAGAKTNSET